jgi:outer membrane protein OmpA-like peptidoglycan-associated protein
VIVKYPNIGDVIMCSYFRQLILASAVTSSLCMMNTAWAITPDGRSGNGTVAAPSAPAPRVSAPVASQPANRSARPILQNPTKESVEKALGIRQPKSRDINALHAAGFGSLIEFETDSDTVIPSGGLNVILSALLDLEPDASIEIRGHTDSTGSEEYNLDLSRRRAEAVRFWFEANGVRRGAIRTSGAGPYEPIASNASEAGRRQNRRVEFARIYQ